MAAVSIIGILPILLICLFATFFVVIFVARDANKRNMSALAWALVAALTPFFLGLIIYLICRKPLVDLQCPKCEAGISQYDRICPKCGQTILMQCPQCDFPVQKGWNTCPSCGTEFPKDYSRPVRNYKKDNGMVAVIIVAVLALLTLLVSVYSLFSMRNGVQESHGTGGFEGMYNITAEDMLENEAISEWIKNCNASSGKAYVLVSNSSNTILIYAPNTKYLLNSDADLQRVVEGEEEGKISLWFYINSAEYEDNYGYDFFLYEYEGELTKNSIKNVYLDGKDCSAEVTFTDADISWETWRDGNETE